MRQLKANYLKILGLSFVVSSGSPRPPLTSDLTAECSSEILLEITFLKLGYLKYRLRSSIKMRNI